MANELRVRTGFLGGLIEDNPLTSGGTTLTSSALAVMPAIGATQHMAVVLDPDGFAGAPEVVYVTAHSAAATTATILRGQEGSTARAHDRDMVWVHSVTVKDFDGASGGSGLLGLTAHVNGTDTSYGSVTGTTFGDVDATNLAVAFTGPPSGRVLVKLSALCNPNNGGTAGVAYWGLRSASSDVTGSSMYVTDSSAASNAAFRRHAEALIVGLTPGSAYVFKWSAKKGSGTAPMNIYSGPTMGQAVMEVWAVNC